MEGLLKIIIDHWLSIAIIMSIFWGIRGMVLFTQRESWTDYVFWWSYQFIFNSVGSMAGWCCFYILAVRAQNKLPELQDFSLGDFLLFIFALLGLTGHLPQVIYGFVESFGKLAEAAMKRISSTGK